MKNSVARKLKQFKKILEMNSRNFLGYPCNVDHDYRPLFDFFRFSLNNVGDPFSGSNYRVNSREFEIATLNFFADLYKISRKKFWGYVTSGGTEGNMYGIFIGRELYPDGILYFSEDTHYSIPKVARVLKIPHVMVRSLPNGEIDYEDLESWLKVNRGKPAILNLNIGTTMKGAIDDLDLVLAILKRNQIKNYHIHCDAALFGMMLPFLKNAPAISFKKPIGSLAISGHKFIGSPFPSGIVLTRKEFVRKIERQVEYVQSLDTTIAGSRNGHSPLLLWYALSIKGRAGFKKEAELALKNARYLCRRLVQAGESCLLNHFSNIVVFKRPSDKLIRKWQLAPYGEWAHVVMMQHATKSKLDKFFKDLIQDLNHGKK